MIEPLREGVKILRDDGVVRFVASIRDFTRFQIYKRYIVNPLSQLYYNPSDDPFYIMNEDWDNLILLDACRYDLFEEVNKVEGDLEHRISLASATPEFLTENFVGETYHDTVYVTANPMYRTQDLDGVFYDVIDVWRDNWDSERNTVSPEAMAAATTEAQASYPNKRILAHFMQPHYPFIGSIAAEIGDHAGSEKTYREVTGEEGGRDNPTVWELLENNKVSKEIVWEAYKENLELALVEVQHVLAELDGKSVITSDHGNLLGERLYPFGSKVYGHPPEVRHEGLCKVPWLTPPFESRREIVAENPRQSKQQPAADVSDRLADLGYVDP